MDQRDLPLLTVAELAPHLEKQDVSPVEVVAAYLERIERLDAQLHAYVTVCRAEAPQAAHEAEQASRRGQYRGLLHEER